MSNSGVYLKINNKLKKLFKINIFIFDTLYIFKIDTIDIKMLLLLFFDEIDCFIIIIKKYKNF
jgi:hypothetical protein